MLSRTFASGRQREASGRFVFVLDDRRSTPSSWNQPGQWSQTDRKVLDRLKRRRLLIT
jgi:hypothetical protein